MKIYTKTGDEGTTGLFSGERVEKSHPLVVAYGTVDECNAHLGVALSAGCLPPVAQTVEHLQDLLFLVGADLATLPGARSIRRISLEDVENLEKTMDALQELLPPLRSFVLPGGSPAAAHLQLARTVCRRAEREAFAAARAHPVNPQALLLLNRLSDYLFLLARQQNHLSGTPERPWVSRRPSS